MINLWYVYDKFMKVYDESMIHLWNIYDTSRINLRYLSENTWTTLINHDKSMIHLGYIYDTSVFCVRNIWYIYWYIYDTSIIHLWYIYHKSMINLDTLDCLGIFYEFLSHGDFWLTPHSHCFSSRRNSHCFVEQTVTDRVCRIAEAKCFLQGYVLPVVVLLDPGKQDQWVIMGHKKPSTND